MPTDTERIPDQASRESQIAPGVRKPSFWTATGGSSKLSSVAHMSNMFRGCTSSQTSRLSEWDTSSVKSTVGMFHDCPYITDATPLEGWRASSSVNKGSMFPAGCKAPSWYSA